MSGNNHPTTQTEKVVTLRTRKLSKAKLQHIEETIAQAKQTKIEYCGEVLEFSMEQLISCLSQFGIFQDSTRITTKDMILLEQALESVLFRYNGLHHPIHEIVEGLIIQDGPDEESEQIEEELD